MHYQLSYYAKIYYSLTHPFKVLFCFFLSFRGVWNVPYISNIMLIQGQVLPKLKDAYTYSTNFDADMSFCSMARDKVCIYIYIYPSVYLIIYLSI